MDIDEYDENGLTPLMKAANDGDYDEVKRLLELGADPDKTDKEFGTTKAEDLAGMKANDSAVHLKIQKLLMLESNSDSGWPEGKVAYTYHQSVDFNAIAMLIYEIGFNITAIITFIACWIGAIASFGFLLGVGLGWIPSFFIAIIAGFIWPLLALVLVVGLIVIAVIIIGAVFFIAKE